MTGLPGVLSSTLIVIFSGVSNNGELIVLVDVVVSGEVDNSAGVDITAGMDVSGMALDIIVAISGVSLDGIVLVISAAGDVPAEVGISAEVGITDELVGGGALVGYVGLDVPAKEVISAMEMDMKTELDK